MVLVHQALAPNSSSAKNGFREQENKTMTITFSDGRAVEALLMTRTETMMRAMIRGVDDVTEFSNISGVWVSADCEPVTIEFAWQRLNPKPAISEADCHCSHELAARLIRLLYTDSNEDRAELGV